MRDRRRVAARRRAGRGMAILASLALAISLAGCAASATGTPAPVASPASASATITPAASPAVTATLRTAAGDLIVGTAVEPRQLTDPTYTAVLTREFNAVTPENALKWESVEPARGQFDWSAADAILAFAEAHDQKVRGHTLVWHNQLPAWLTAGTFTAGELRDILKSHIATEAGRYKGRIYAWDVVNEVIDDNGGLRDSIWAKGLGAGYIADAFRWARAADPTARLYINDYDVEGINPKSDALYALVKSLKAEGVPIDGVGIQAHLSTEVAFPVGIADNIARFADLGLEVALTELDVRTKTPATPDELAKQADYYRGVSGACVASKACVGVTVWQFSDKYSWVPFTFPGLGAADIFDANLAPKPAYSALLAALSARAP